MIVFRAAGDVPRGTFVRSATDIAGDLRRITGGAYPLTIRNFTVSQFHSPRGGVGGRGWVSYLRWVG